MNLSLNTSIKRRIVAALMGAVLLTALSIGLFSRATSYNIIEERVVNFELPALMTSIRGEIEEQISVMQAVAKIVAEDPIFLDWSAKGHDKSFEPLIIKRLEEIARLNNLSNVSVVDKNTAKQWNSRVGYYGELTPDNAGWYYAYKDSGRVSSISVYTSQNTGNTSLYVNHQQLRGNGLAGTAKSFDEISDMLASFKIEESGFVYLVDNKGNARMHKDFAATEEVSLTALYGDGASALLQGQEYTSQTVTVNDEELVIVSSYIPMMGWYLVAQVPAEEIYAPLVLLTQRIVLWTLLVLTIAALLAVFLAKGITNPIKKLSDLFKELGQGEANLDYQLPEKGQRELVEVAEGYNAFIRNLRSAFNSIAESSQRLKELSNMQYRNAENTLNSTNASNEQTTLIADKLEVVFQSADKVAANAEAAAGIASQLQHNGEIIKGSIDQSQQQMTGLSNQIIEVASIIDSLNQNTESIVKALEVIDNISQQTNLLALNAAIEAARAGEQGRGFAVVADEVRALAQKTADSTKEIQSVIENLVSTSNAATSDIRTIESKSTETTAAFEDMLNKLYENNALFDQIANINQQASQASGEQRELITTIHDRMSTIQEGSKENQKNVQGISESSSDLVTISNSLDVLTQKFK